MSFSDKRCYFSPNSKSASYMTTFIYLQSLILLYPDRSVTHSKSASVEVSKCIRVSIVRIHMYSEGGLQVLGINQNCTSADLTPFFCRDAVPLKGQSKEIFDLQFFFII